MSPETGSTCHIRLDVQPTASRDNKIRSKILTTLSSLDIRVIRLKNNNYNGFTVTVTDTVEVEKIFTEECINQLSRLRVTPIMSQELTARRTILAFHVDKYLYDE